MNINHVWFLTGNHIINCAFLGWFLAQIIKVVLTYISKKTFDMSRLTGSGGMPSSHSACVVALATAVAQISGFHSVEFALALTLAGIVMYDATGVRRAAGEQAKILNYMMDNWRGTTPESFQKDLKELLGHTPIQVIAGAIFGCIVALVMGEIFLYV